MKPDTKKIVQAVDYILSKAPNNKITKLYLLKLIYLADRFHLRKYGRTITGDTYYAMKFGPVASKTKDVLELTGDVAEYASQFFMHQSDDERVCVMIRTPQMDVLSQTDVEALDCAMDQVLTHDDLVKFTHKFPEWKNQSEALSNAQSRVKMNMLDFFSTVEKAEDEYCAVSPELVALNREIYQETPVLLRR